LNTSSTLTLWKTQKGKALQDVRLENCSNKGEGPEVVGCMLYQRGAVPNMTSNCSHGQTEEWKIADVHKFD
jgi:hypothetical protein